MKRALLSITGMLCFVVASYAQISVALSTTPTDCWPGNTGSIATTVTGGATPYSFIWSNGDTTQNLTGLTAGVYVVTVTDFNGQSATAWDTIEPPYYLNVTTTTTNNCSASNSSASVMVSGGTAPYTFLWSNGATTSQINGLAAGVYTVTVMDAGGCSGNSTIVVQQGTLSLAVSLHPDSCAGTTCAIATSTGGTNPMYSWNTGALGSMQCGLPNGTYSVTASDQFGCTAAQSFTVVNQPILQATLTTIPASCGNDGAIVLTSSGGTPPYMYFWSNNAVTQNQNNLPAGNYTVTVVDANACQVVQSATITSGSLNLVSANATPVTCATATDGTVSVTVSGTNPPFTYLWSNGDTTASVNNLSAGTYMVTVSDNNGCVLVQTLIVQISSLQAAITQVQSANCQGNSGKLVAYPTNGSGPYTYEWSNGSTIDTASNLSVGGHTVTITDANGCSAVRHHFVTINQHCYTVLTGKVYVELEGDCNLTAADYSLGGVIVKINPNYTAYTQSNGVWRATVPLGNYEIFVPNLGAAAMLQDTCGINSIAISVLDTNTITGLDFPKSTTVHNNVSVTLQCGTARPGFAQTTTVSVYNHGFDTATVSGSVVLSSALTAIPTTNLPLNVTIDSITYNPTTVYYTATQIPPRTSVGFSIIVTVPTIPIVSLGQILTASANVTLTSATDQVLDNNSYTCSTSIVGSYDPNDKQVFNADGGSIDGPAAVEDTLLHYLIRFQNTGTDTAFNIVVRDTLDEHLSVSTFRFIASSHDVQISFEQERIVVFTFSNILLPDSNVNEPMSHGFIEFDIEVLDKGQLNEVSNQAAIYFDFNPPIFTNTVVTQRTVGITEKVTVPVSIFPNPTSGKLSANLGGLPVDAVEMYDLIGRLVLSQSFDATLQADFDATQLQGGLYIVRMRSGADWYQERVVIAK